MRVFRFEGDPDYVCASCLTWEQDKAIMAVDHNGTSIDSKTTIQLKYSFNLPEEEGVVTDCPYFSNGNALLLSRKAVDALGPLLEEAGVLLQITPDLDMSYQLFVCTTKIDALDTEKTELLDQSLFMPWDIRRYAFHPNALEGAGIFHVKGLPNRLFATDRLLEAMTGNRLSGFRIRPVWSSEHGPLATLEDSAGTNFIKYPPGFGTTLQEKRQAMRDYIARRR